LAIVLVMNLGLIAGLVIVGLSAHSLGVLAEGVDYLADTAAINVTLLATWLSDRPPTLKRPKGFPPAGLSASHVVGVVILALGGSTWVWVPTRPGDVPDPDWLRRWPRAETCCPSRSGRPSSAQRSSCWLRCTRGESVAVKTTARSDPRGCTQRCGVPILDAP
jgi:hypothetical protein